MPPPSARVNIYLGKAVACRIAAELTDLPTIHTKYLDVGKQWETMAKQIERMEAEHARPPRGCSRSRAADAKRDHRRFRHARGDH
jgi:hypothetical protein